MFKIILTIGTFQALAVFIQFIKSKIIAVYLGPAGVGIVGTVDQFVQLVAFISVFGLPAASIKFLSRSHSEGDIAFKRSYAGFFKLLLFLSATGAVFTIGISLLKSDFLGIELAKYQEYLILGLLTLPTFTLSTLFINVFASAQKFRESSFLVLITNIVSMTAGVSGVIIAGIFGLYIGNLLAGILIIFVVIIYFRAKLGLPIYDRQTALREEVKSNSIIFSTALLLYLSAITASLSYVIARYAVLKSFGEVEAGLLHGIIALSFAFGTVLYPAINVYLTPLVNRNIDAALKVQQVIQFQRKIALILSLAALPILMFPKLMLTIILSEKFTSVSGLVYLFVISQFIVQLTGVYQSLLVGLDDVKSYTFITSSGQIISALLCLILVPYFGIKGVAFGFLIGSSFNFTVSLIRLISKYNFFIPLKIGLLLGYTFSALIFTGWICGQLDEWSITVVSAKLLFLLLFGSSLMLFLNKEEKNYLVTIRRKIFRGNH